MVRKAEKQEYKAREEARQVLSVLILLPTMVAICVLLFRGQSEDERYSVQLASLSPQLSADWSGSTYVKESLKEGFLGIEKLSILDQNLTQVVRQAYESSPWVKRVKGVKRIFPSGLEVDLEFRRPFAAVERDGVYLLVDQNGELLPVEYQAPQAPPPVISVHPEGNVNKDAGLFHEEWFVAAVKEGVAIIKDLEVHADSRVFEEIAIEKIDVSNFGGRLASQSSEISLVTSRRWYDAKKDESRPLMLSWGRSSAHARAVLEIPLSAKISHLAQLISRRHRNLVGIRAVDLRFSELYFRE